jgi:RNA polymerase sigma factor (sigma-70 family)
MIFYDVRLQVGFRKILPRGLESEQPRRSYNSIGCLSGQVKPKQSHCHAYRRDPCSPNHPFHNRAIDDCTRARIRCRPNRSHRNTLAASLPPTAPYTSSGPEPQTLGAHQWSLYLEDTPANRGTLPVTPTKGRNMIAFFSSDFAKTVDKNATLPIDKIIRAEQRSALHRRIDRLQPREQAALRARYGLDPSTESVAELAARWKITTQRVYQIVHQALAELGASGAIRNE